MEKVLSCYQMVTDVLARLIIGVAAVIIGLDVLLLFAESVGRYILGSSRAFMEEFPRLLVPFVVFPMMGVLLKMGRHISVDVLPDRLNPKQQTMLKILVYGIILAVAVELLIAGAAAVGHFKMMGLMSITEWTFPMWWVYLTFPLGFALLIIFVLEMLLRECWRLYTIVREEGGPDGKGVAP